MENLSTRLAYTGLGTEIKSSGGLATHNGIGAELVDEPGRCHNIVGHACATVLLDPFANSVFLWHAIVDGRSVIGTTETISRGI